MMTNEQRKLSRVQEFEQGWGNVNLQLCEEVIRTLMSVDDLHTAIAVLDLAKARIRLRLADDESGLRRLNEELLTPVIEFVPQPTAQEKERA